MCAVILFARNPITTMHEEIEKIQEFSREVSKTVVAELHVHAVLAISVIMTAHHIEESHVGIVVSVVLIGGSYLIRHRYHHKIVRITRLDRVVAAVIKRKVIVKHKGFSVHYRF